MQAIKLILASLFLFTSCLWAQSAADIAKARDFEGKAGASYKARDFKAFLENMQRADELRPNHPRLIYNLADAYALNDKTTESEAAIKRLIAMGLYFALEKDDDFKSLGAEKLRSIQVQFDRNKQPVNSSTRAFTLPDKELVPEGIAYDPRTGTFYVSSIHKGKIVSIKKDGGVSDLSSTADALWSVTGMKVDGKRGLLWAAVTAFPQLTGFKPEDAGRAGIVKYDLKTGKLLKKYVLPAGEGHVLGDLTLDSTGNVYATDSAGPNIYRLTTAKDDLEVFLSDPVFASLQGLAFSQNDEMLFVADYSKGIFRVDMASKEITQLRPSSNVTLLGIDGLYFYGRNSLVAVQNGVNPQRVLLIALDLTRTAVLTAAILEANHSDISEPTLGMIRENMFYFVANGQFGLVNDKGVLDAEKARPPVVLKLKLD